MEMTDTMFMNSNSSTESNSDEKCRLPTMNLIFSDETQFTVKEQQQQQIRKRSSSRNSLINHRDLSKLNRKSFDGSMRINNGIESNNSSYWRSTNCYNTRSSENFRLEKTGYV